MMKDKDFDFDFDIFQKNEYEEPNKEPENRHSKGNALQIKHPKLTVGLILLAGCLIGILLTIAFTLATGGRIITPKQNNYYKGLEKTYGKAYVIEELLKNNAYYKFDNNYTEDIIARNLVKGLKDDKYAVYYNKTEYENLKRNYIDSYVGIGVACAESENNIVVVRVIKNGPAMEAGIKPGDVIKMIDGKSVSDIENANDLLAGESGESVKLSVLSGGKTKEYDLTRTELEEECIEYFQVKDAEEIGYIKLFKFREKSSDEFEAAVKDLKAKGCKKLIIDLRSNPGGLREEGVKVADMLLPSGIIMTVKSSNGEKKVEKSDESSIDMPYVLIVDENTASASEIVAAAVKDNKGGKIIGKNTYGKGLIQSIREFDDGTAVKFTVSEYLSPKGKAINEKGVVPDYVTDKPVQKALELLSK